jgi:hypothetical protein
MRIQPNRGRKKKNKIKLTTEHTEHTAEKEKIFNRDYMINRIVKINISIHFSYPILSCFLNLCFRSLLKFYSV